ncbi:MAG: hypothetical protein ACXWFC_12440 [Nitrososphaeraceae archaeon]
MQNTQKRVNWKNDVIPIIKERLALFNRYGIIPTLKTIFYSLVFLNIIPNSYNYYKYLSKYVNHAKIKGDLPIGCFPEQDLPRITNSYTEFVNAKEYIQKIVNYLEETSANPSIQDYQLNNKSNHIFNDIEIWVEKNAPSFTLHSLLKNSGVKIISNKRTNNLEFINKNIKRLKCSFKDDKKIYILYYGNFDLFNNNIDKIINNTLMDFNLNIDFNRIAVTENQMRKFHLPENPNPEIIRKLDSNIGKDYFIRKYGRLFQIELESFQAYAPENFKNIVIESVNNISNKYRNCENIKNIHLMA